MSAFCGSATPAPTPIAIDTTLEALAAYGPPTVQHHAGGPLTLRIAVNGNGLHASLGTSPDGSVTVSLLGYVNPLANSAPSLEPAAMIADGYRRHGTQIIDRLRGAFALAIVDHAQGQVLLVRDHVGSHFLCFATPPDGLLYSTTALSLAGAPGVAMALDETKVIELAAGSYASYRTLIEGVREVKPGTVVTYSDRGVQSRRWWRPDVRPPRVDRGIEAHAAELRDTFEQAVQRSLEGVNTPGVLVSGGLDSSSIAAVTCTLRPDDTLRGYTAVPPSGWQGPVPHLRIADERFAVEALARRYPNLTTEFIQTKDQDLFAHLENLWELGAGPLRNPLNHLWYHRCFQDGFADGLDVMLQGVSGNIGFSADGPRWLVDWARRFRYDEVWREASSWGHSTGRSTAGVLRGFLLTKALPHRYRVRRARARELDLMSIHVASNAVAERRLADIDVEGIYPMFVEPHPWGWTKDLERAFDDAGAQAEAIGAYRALYGIETREPTSDRDLLELTALQPERWRRRRGVDRSICRMAMDDLLPEEIGRRRSVGLQAADWFDRLTDAKDQLWSEVRQMRDHPMSREVFDLERLERHLAAWPERSRMADDDVISDYLSALTRAIYLGRYMRWFDERKRRIEAGGPRVVQRSEWDDL